MANLLALTKVYIWLGYVFILLFHIQNHSNQSCWLDPAYFRYKHITGGALERQESYLSQLQETLLATAGKYVLTFYNAFQRISD